MASSNRDSGAGTRAARERFTYAAFEHAQAYVRAIDDFHETDVHSARESWVTLNRGPQPVDWRACHRRDGEHRMRIAHRNRTDFHLGAGNRKRIHMRFRRGFERQGFRIEIGQAHVHRYEIAIVNARADLARGTVEHDVSSAFLR
jgi:hypothetical protein